MDGVFIWNILNHDSRSWVMLKVVWDNCVVIKPI